MKKNKLNDLNIRSWRQSEGGIEDIEHYIRFFTEEGDRVLDSFGSIGSVMMACAASGRRGVQIEECLARHTAARKRVKAKFGVRVLRQHNFIRGNVLDWLPIISGMEFDLVILSISRQNIAEIGNYSGFLVKLWEIMRECHKLVKPGGYVVSFVKDFRIGPLYHFLHYDVMKTLERAGFLCKGVQILTYNSQSTDLEGVGNEFIPDICHSNVLIHRKEEDPSIHQAATIASNARFLLNTLGE